MHAMMIVKRRLGFFMIQALFWMKNLEFCKKGKDEKLRNL
jgi:hypothetical protein